MENRNILHGILLLPDISKNLPVAMFYIYMK